MQYLLTEEEFKAVIPASSIEPFTKALADYYERKSEHLMNCISNVSRDDIRFGASIDGPFAAAVARHRREWTEKPPKPKDFIKK